MAQKQTILFVFLITYTSVYAQVGDRCIVRRSNTEGTCKLESECPAAQEQAKKGISPTKCGYHLLTQLIVCCADSVEVNDLTSPTTDIDNEDTNKQFTNQHVNLRKSEQKCDEYSKPVESVVSVLPLISDVQPIPIKVAKCDYNSVPLIIGGEPAEPGEFPFMALIGFNTTTDPWKCGGTIISERYILTAAHCTYSRDVGQPTVVRLGELDLTSENDGSQYKDYVIAKIITHPGYNYPLKYNDIALIKTRDAITFSNFIRPACLNWNPTISSDKALATGFGKTDLAGEFSNRLMKVTLDLFNLQNQRCQKTYQNDVNNLPQGLISSQLCAGFLKGGKDTCHGDSGGPLVVTKAGNMCQFFVVGITSFGRLCGQRNTPGIYTKVSSYVDWIENEVW